MAKNKVEWSVEARLDLFDILSFYLLRNGNAKYSRNLNSKINKSIKHIENNPFIGLKTNQESVYLFITGDYQIIYELIDSVILIVMIWDSRRNPDDKSISTQKNIV
ncbi:MAG: type II toxin-antitoxin system RelE/ParE family toxin [Bacteroidota bacterium]